MTTRYTQAMDDLQYTPAQLDAMVQDLAAAAPPEASPSGASHKRGIKCLVAPLLAATLALGAASAAIAAGSGGAFLDQFFSRVFCSSPTNELIAEQLGTPVGASQTSDGVTITLDGTVADGTHLTCLFTVEPAQENPNQALVTALESYPAESFFLENGTDPELYTPPVDQSSGLLASSAVFYDADPADAAIQCAYTFVLNNAHKPAQTARLAFARLYTYGPTGDAVRDASNGQLSDQELARLKEQGLVASGSWEFELDLSPTATRIAPAELTEGPTFDVDGMDVTVTHVTVTPLRVVANVVVESHVFAPAIYNLPITVTLDNGETVGTSPGTFTMAEADLALRASRDEQVFTVRYEYQLNQVVDPLDVAAVSLGETVMTFE